MHSILYFQEFLPPFSLSKALLFCPFNAQIEISLYISSAFIFPISLNAKAPPSAVVIFFTAWNENEVKSAWLPTLLFLSDAAHSIGAIYKDKRVGCQADFTSFSFHAVKNITTAEGGALAFNDIGNIKADEKGISFGCPRARMHSWQQRKRYERGSAQCLNVWDDAG